MTSIEVTHSPVAVVPDVYNLSQFEVSQTRRPPSLCTDLAAKVNRIIKNNKVMEEASSGRNFAEMLDDPHVEQKELFYNNWKSMNLFLNNPNYKLREKFDSNDGSWQGYGGVDNWLGVYERRKMLFSCRMGKSSKAKEGARLFLTIIKKVSLVGYIAVKIRMHDDETEQIHQVKDLVNKFVEHSWEILSNVVFLNHLRTRCQI